MPIQFTEEDLNPTTNLPKKQGGGIPIGDLADDIFSKPTKIADPLFFDTKDFTNQYTDDLSKYTDYGVVPTRFSDWDEQRAQNQSTGEKWTRGLAKAGVTTLGAVAENTVGIIAGIGSLLSGEDYYDNAVGRTVDKVNDWARTEMPNYYTQKEENMGAVQRLGTANFWADKAMNGLGYSLGSIATMALTGGTGYIGMAGKAMGASKLATLGDKAARIHKLYKTTKSATTAGKLTDMMGKVSAGQRFKSAGQMLDAGIMMSLAESSVEARETKKHVYDTLVQNALEKEGLEYDYQLGEEKLNEFEKAASAAGNTNFGLNMSVLSLSNAYMFAKMMSPKYTPRAGALNGIKKNQAGEWADNTSKGWRKGWKRSKPVLQGSAAEGIQEGSQYASNIASTEFYTSKFSDMGGISRAEALNEGLSRTFGETDGIESILLGIVTGGIMGGGSSIINKPTKARDAAAQQVLDILNTGEFLGTADKAQGQERTLKLLELMEQAYKDDNPGLAEQYRTQALMSDIITMDNAGLTDLYKEKLDDAAYLSDSEFARQFGYNETVPFDKQKVINDLKKDVDLIVKRKNAIDAMVPTQRTLGVPRMLMSEEDRTAEENRIKESVILKDKLLQQSVFLDKVDQYKKETSQEINDIISGTTLSRIDKAADSAKEEYDRLIEEAILLDDSVTNENELPEEVKQQAFAIAYQKYIADSVDKGVKINPADQSNLEKNLGKYYSLHAAEQEVFEDWNRLQTNAGKEEYIRAALLDADSKIKEEADKSTKELIQQETDPEKLATNTSQNASQEEKNNARKEVRNINRIKANISKQYNKEDVSIEEIDAAIEERKDSELKMPFENSEDKQAYLELVELRKIKKSKEKEGVNQEAIDLKEKSKEVQETALIVDSPDKLKKVYAPAHTNQVYTHMTLLEKENITEEYLDKYPIGTKKKLKIVGRYRSDRMDVIIVEAPGMSQNSQPFIVLALEEGVSMEEVQPALFKAKNDSKIKTYKTNRYVDTTFGYIDGNGNKITEEATETEAQEKIDSPATQEQLELFPPTQNLSELEVQNETESVEEEQNIPPEMAPMEEYTSDVDNFTDDSNVIIIEDAFVSEEEQAATLEAFNVEKAKMTGENVEESVEEVVSKKPRFSAQQTSEVKEGVSNVFEENKELSKIGTEQQYSDYLDTLFPDSKVKDIVYHGTPDGRFDNFDINQVGKNTKQSTKGIYFTDSKKTADFYAEGSIDFSQFESLEEYNAVKTAKVFSAILNAKNLKLVNNPQAQDRQGDAVLRTKEKLSDKGFVGELDYAYQYIVFEPEQIHILGNKKDLKGFKEFVGKPALQTSEVEAEIKRLEAERDKELLANNKLKFQDLKTKVSNKFGTLQDSKAELLEKYKGNEVIEFIINNLYDVNPGSNAYVDLDEWSSSEISKFNLKSNKLEEAVIFNFPELTKKELTNILSPVSESIFLEHKGALLAEAEGPSGLPDNLSELNAEKIITKYEKLIAKAEQQQTSEAPVQSLGAIMSQEQILAEEEALRKEMEQLKNSLNKEDDNCAT